MLEKTISFLNELGRNNFREWFEDHKEVYLEAKAEFDEFIFTLIPRLSALDPFLGMPEVRNCTYRIYRDIRFSKDKTPYKQHMAAYIARGGRNSPFAGYYFHLEPLSTSFCSGGIYCPDKNVLRAIREEVDGSWDEFNGLITESNFWSHYQWFESKKLKTAPKGFSKTSPALDWLRRSDFCFFHPLTCGDWLSEDLPDLVTEHFKGMIPVNGFFNRAIRMEQEEAAHYPA